MTAEGRTALYKAGGNERPDIAKLLLQYGADPALGRGRYGETTIYKAAWYNDLETVDLLLDFELDVNMPNDEKMNKYSSVGEKALHGVLGGLSKDHALMNAWGKTALHAAAYRGHADMVSLLLEEGADLEMKGKDGETALYLAAEQKHERTVQILLKAGAKLETEKHDPVLSLINERQNKRGEKVKDVVKTSGSGVGTDMARIGTGDPVVSLVADIAKAWSKSRRARK